MTVDTELVRAAQAGDEAAVEALFALAWPQAYRIAFAITGHRAAAEDATQEAFLNAWRGLSGLRRPESFVSWLWRLVGREARRAVRSRREWPTDDLTAEVPTPTRDPDLAQALASLSETDRRLVTLAYGLELSSAEIGRVLGIPSPTVRFRLGRIRARLRRDLGETYPVGDTLSVSTEKGKGR